MSIRISLTDQPEFYTNLDVMNGRVILSLTRTEQVGAIIVKLEGESRTALALPDNDDSPNAPQRPRPPAGAYPGGVGGNIVHENHKILYKVAQVFPDDSVPAMAVPVSLQPGQYEFPFRFKMPFNNSCSDPAAMSKIGGLAGAGGYAAGPGLFGLGGIRVMDGSKQLMYQHVTKTLPPSFTGFPRQAEIRYFIKVTIQRPGLFKENWRYQIGLKFLPIEPPRPESTSQEAYARRPFTFQPRTPDVQQEGKKPKRGSIFSQMLPQQRSASAGSIPTTTSTPGPVNPNKSQPGVTPSIEMSARLPHPSILTCNKPIPLRLIARKRAPSREQVYLVSLQIDLIGLTKVRCQDLLNTEETRWVVVSRPNLRIPLFEPSDDAGTEQPLSDNLWSETPLPNTVMPTFQTCNLSREYKLELKLGLSWGLPAPVSGKGKATTPHPQAIFLPLLFSAVDVYSGMAPPASLLRAMSTRPAVAKPPKPVRKPSRPSAGTATASGSTAAEAVPPLPPRVGTGDVPPPQYEEAPPSYDEAMAEEMTGPLIPGGAARPAYSGVTNENAPLTIPEKG